MAVSIPKQQNAKTIEQFRSIALLNVEGKTFFSVMARRMTTYLKDDVASETVRSHLISRKPDGGESQLLHPQMAWPASVLLSCWPVWMELTPTTPEIHYPGLQAGEGKAGDGVKGLLRQYSG